MKNKFIVWGSSGHCKVLKEIIDTQNGEIVAVFDNNETAKSIDGRIPLYIGRDGFLDWLRDKNPKEYNGLVAIGGANGLVRTEIHSLFTENGINVNSLFHDRSTISASTVIGDGCQFLAGSLVSSECQIGDACILNHNASVDHECIIGNGVHLAPRATLCGLVNVGDYAMIGAGSIILPRLKIGKSTVIGAGSVVTKDIPDNVVAYGNPARIIKKHGD